MKLIFDEHTTSSTNPLSQIITVGDNPIDLYAVTLHLYKHGSPAGSLAVAINSAAGSTLATSSLTSISSMTTAVGGTATYWHADVRFPVSLHLAANTQYRIVLISSGYTHSSTAFVGWCRGFDLGNGSGTYDNPVGSNAPYQLGLFGYQWKVKGA